MSAKGSDQENYRSKDRFVSRRALLSSTALGAGAVAAGVALGGNSPAAAATTSGIYVNVLDFGATGNGTTDDTAAIQSAINSLPKSTGTGLVGGTIFFPAGNYLCKGSLIVDNLQGVVFLGTGSPIYGAGNLPASSLSYAGTGASFISARSTLGFTCRGLGIVYTNSGFTGDLIDYSHSSAGVDSGYGLVDQCLLSGPDQTYSARSLINWYLAIVCSVQNTHLAFCSRGIIGKIAGGYSNANQVLTSSFNGCQLTGVCNPGEGWMIHGNTFESGGHALWDDQGRIGSLMNGGSFVGNWMGDTNSTATPSWIGTSGSIYHGWHISGNIFNDAPGIDLNSSCQGVVIEGNTFAFYNTPAGIGINLEGPTYTQTGVAIIGNTFDDCSAAVANNVGHTNLSILANNGVANYSS